jgi:predicted metal-dependent phosphoesterase TrpH
VAHGIEVLGITDHHFVRSIYFFDPNGLRLELTVPVASTETLAAYRREARPALDAWASKGKSVA